ncbi:MAG: hypothetical protein GWO02_04645 [Gammaproteobacteria bacterium]|nr:hypothetical protein [Gammaproteobacteria bacterium]
MGGGEHRLVDSRDLLFYLGLRRKPYVARAGHIPGAKPYGHALIVETFPATLRSRAELRAVARAMGVDLERPATTYCNSGNLSGGVWPVLSEVLGMPEAKMYDGSMHAWTQDSERPVVALRRK